MNSEIYERIHALLDAGQGETAATRASVAIRFERESWAALVARSGVAGGRWDDAGAAPQCLTYSITKSFTAAAVLRLCMSGELALDEPVARWLPRIPNGERVSVRQLLQHTSGMPDYGGLAEYHSAVRAGAEPWPFETFLEQTGAGTLRFAPGSGWAYSNIGYMIVKRLLETVRGESFGAVLRREVFEPLRMDGAWVPTTREELRGLCFGSSRYLAAGGPPVEVAAIYDPGWIATGVVAATAAETAYFCDALFAGKLVDAPFLRQLRTGIAVDQPVPDRPWRAPAYGLGVMTEAGSRPGDVFGHTGAGPGCSTAAYRVENGQRSVAVAAFTDGEDIAQAEHIVWRVAETILLS